MTNSFRVGPIDHVELFVPDRYEAAKWYEQVLGFKILREFEEWAGAADGPLMISTDEGETKLALFVGQPKQEPETAGFRRVAFRVDGVGFLEFLERLDSLELNSHNGKALTREDVVDHDQAFSIYFRDPYGHRLEITTYDYDFVSGQLRGCGG